jgi:hypothetical protein
MARDLTDGELDWLTDADVSADARSFQEALEVRNRDSALRNAAANKVLRDIDQLAGCVLTEPERTWLRRILRREAER